MLADDEVDARREFEAQMPDLTYVSELSAEQLKK
jgi:hypothetical protein